MIARKGDATNFTAALLGWSDHIEIQRIDLSDAHSDKEAKATGILRAMDWVTDNGVACVRLRIVRGGHEIGTYDVTPHLHRR